MTITRSPQIVEWTDESQEHRILDSISLDVPWSVVENFSSLVRLSGSPEERKAFDLLVGHLNEWEIPHRLHEPETFISLPGAASVRAIADGTVFHANTPAMSISTDGKEVEAELVYVPS